jgi:Zn-finger nucleic acid-binding protein
MKKITYTIIISLLLLFQNSYAQASISDYHFILIPQQFEFQRQQDEFRLNTYIRHLFNQNGFNAIYDVEMEGLPRCEGVFLELKENNSMFQTKITIHIKDCMGNELLATEEGASRAKDYETAYKEAFERAFEEIPTLGVQQKELKQIGSTLEKQNKVTKTLRNIPEKDDLILYFNNGKNYLLKKAAQGWELYEVDGTENIFTAKLTATRRNGIYLFVKEGYTAMASFDDEGNLLVEGVDESGNSIEQVYYLKK